MSEKNVARVRDGYDALLRGDAGPLVALMHPDIEWIEPDGAPGVGAMTKGSGVYRGRDDVLTRMFGRLPSIWDDFGVHPETYLDAGDHVVVLGELRARACPTRALQRRRRSRTSGGSTATRWCGGAATRTPRCCITLAAISERTAAVGEGGASAAVARDARRGGWPRARTGSGKATAKGAIVDQDEHAKELTRTTASPRRTTHTTARAATRSPTPASTRHRRSSSGARNALGMPATRRPRRPGANRRDGIGLLRGGAARRC